MSVKFVQSLNVDVFDGSFAIDTIPLRFIKCRERFAKHFTSETHGLFFKHPAGKHANIKSFLAKTESILKESVLTEVSTTNLDTVSWIEPSFFWKSCEMRRSLLTVLLRSAIFYDGDYEKALYSQEFLSFTAKAINRFLLGYTEYHGPSLRTEGEIQIRGWRSIFEGKNADEIEAILTKPSRRTIDHAESNSC